MLKNYFLALGLMAFAPVNGFADTHCKCCENCTCNCDEDCNNCDSCDDSCECENCNCCTDKENN